VKKKIFVRGPVLSQSGYGEQSRFALRALKSREDLFDIYVQPIPWGQTGWIWKEDEFRTWLDQRIAETQILIQKKELQPDTSLQITIPNEFQKICPVNIGYTAGIETDKCSPQWLPKCNDMDKVLVVSNHAKTSIVDTVATATNNQTGEQFAYKCETPVEVVWESTPRHEQEHIPGFDLEFDNNFLVVSQMGPRKNFENTIKWFVEEFIDKEVGLVVKTNIRSNCFMDFQATEQTLKNILSNYKNRICKVYLLHGDLTPGQMTGLYNNSKISALINLSHGEGFGLPMFEAAREGLPIIANGWSGQLDFLSYDGKDFFEKVKTTLQPVQKEAVWAGVIEQDSKWAFADQGSYKMTLRRTLKNLDKAKKKAKELQKLVNEHFSDERLFEGFCSSFIDEFDKTEWWNETEEIVEYE